MKSSQKPRQTLKRENERQLKDKRRFQDMGDMWREWMEIEGQIPSLKPIKRDPA